MPLSSISLAQAQEWSCRLKKDKLRALIFYVKFIHCHIPTSSLNDFIRLNCHIAITDKKINIMMEITEAI